MATVSDPGSLLEGLAREPIGDLSEERLLGGFTAAEGVEADRLGIEINFAAHEAMSPERVNREEMSE